MDEAKALVKKEVYSNLSLPQGMRKVSKKKKNNLTFHLMEPEREQSRRRQIKIRVRINEIDIR